MHAITSRQFKVPLLYRHAYTKTTCTPAESILIICHNNGEKQQLQLAEAQIIHYCPLIALVSSIAHCCLFANGIMHLQLSRHRCYLAGAGAAAGLAATDVLLLRAGQEPNMGMIG